MKTHSIYIRSLLLTPLFLLLNACSLAPKYIPAPDASYSIKQHTPPLCQYSDIQIYPLKVQLSCEINEGVLIEIENIIQDTFIRSAKFRTINNFKTASARSISISKTLIIQPTIISYDLECNGSCLSILFELIDNETNCKVGSFNIDADSGNAGLHAAIAAMGIELEQFIFDNH